MLRELSLIPAVRTHKDAKRPAFFRVKETKSKGHYQQSLKHTHRTHSLTKTGVHQQEAEGLVLMFPIATTTSMVRLRFAYTMEGRG